MLEASIVVVPKKSKKLTIIDLKKEFVLFFSKK